jgi:hypothetical protein
VLGALAATEVGVSYPQTTDHSLVWMRCQGAPHDRHSGFSGASFETWVPFLDAIHNPPLCHGLPRLTEGGRRMQNLMERWRESGIALDCRFSSKGEGQGVSCYSHGWHGVYHDLTWERDPATGYREERWCPVYAIAAWLIRRYESVA